LQGNCAIRIQPRQEIARAAVVVAEVAGPMINNDAMVTEAPKKEDSRAGHGGGEGGGGMGGMDF